MSELLPTAPVPELSAVEEMVAEGDVKPLELALLYLYVDALEPAHRIVQQDESKTAAWIHAIIHRREGDFSNSLYWYDRAAGHPELELLSVRPREFVIGVKNEPSADWVAVQRAEWALVCSYVLKEGL